MPKNDPPTPPTPPTTATPSDGSTPGERDRRELQSVLAQIHGLLHAVMENSEKWCDDTILRDSFPNAYADASVAFGRVNAELNTGNHDQELAGAGLAGASFEPKKRGLWKGLKELVRRTLRQGGNAIEYAK